MNRQRIYYALSLAAILAAFMLFELWWSTSEMDSDKEVFEAVSGAVLRPSSSKNIAISHNHYALSYRPDYEQAEWVAYWLLPQHLTQDDRQRPYFEIDDKVPGNSAHWRNYKGSGYDRGHLCPAGDRRFSEQAYNETFFTSNVSPQDREFNAGIWNRLEQQIRRWCKRYGDLYIVTGGVLQPQLEEIGDEGVEVPEYFYKIVYRPSDEAVVSYLIPNQEQQLPLSHFEIAVDELEAKTGIDFFFQLDPRKQAAFESRQKVGKWSYSFN